MIEKFFEDITGLKKVKDVLKYKGKEVGRFVTDEYDNPDNYFGEFIEVSNLPTEISNQLRKKNYFLIFEHSRGCCN